MTVQKTKHIEESASYYDAVYKNARKTGGYNTARYKAVYDTVMDWLLWAKTEPTVLECGCGVGVLGGRIVEDGYKYRGFDFSLNALAECPPLIKKHIYLRNAYDRFTWSDGWYYDTVIAIEVFEHLDDLRVLSFVPVDTRVIFSIPDFSSRSHLRTYPDEESIREYYKDVLTIHDVVKIQTQENKAIFVCNSTRL